MIFEGKATDHLGLLEDYAEKIKQSQPLTAAVLERYTMLIDDLPGFKTKAVIKASEGDAVGSDLSVVLEPNPLDATLSVDNRGSKAQGPFQFSSEVDGNDMLGMFDQTAFRVVVTPHIDELRYFNLSHTEQIGLDGTSFTMAAQRTLSIPGYTSRPLEINSQTTTLRAGFNYPLIRSRSETLRLTLDFTSRDYRSSTFSREYQDDAMRFVSLGALYDIADSWAGRNLFQVGLHKGLPIFHAGSFNAYRPGVKADFTKATFSAQRLQPLPESFAVVFGVDGQYSPDKLVTTEQYGLGGALYGRAFSPSEIVGDSGVAGKIELQYVPELDIPYVSFFQFYTYGDIGSVWTYSVDPRQSQQSLASLGGGIRFGITDAVTAGLEISQPLLRKVADTGNRGPRGFFTLTARY